MGAAKWEVENDQCHSQPKEVTYQEGNANQLGTEVGIHAAVIVQWGTDGHVSVKAHDSQEEAVGTSPRGGEEHLGSTAHVRDVLVSHDQPGEHSGDDAQGVAGLRKREKRKEQVHGGVKMAVQPDDYDNEDIAGQGDKIQAEEDHKEQELQLPEAGEAQEDKAPPGGGVGLPHAE